MCLGCVGNHAGSWVAVTCTCLYARPSFHHACKEHLCDAKAIFAFWLALTFANPSNLGHLG